MTVKWVLIIWFTSNTGGGLATAEFANETACWKALDAFTKTINRRADGICVPQDTVQQQGYFLNIQPE